MEFKGAASGEDGKLGLKGEVVTKQGAILARSLIAGFLSGIGEAFQQSQQYTITGGAGVGTGIQDMSTSEAVQYGMWGGASKAAEKLSDFYLKMADQIAPVIEISAGRVVNIIVTKRLELKTLEDMDNEGKK
jgi:conjugal transfer pilus assembly protein TraB